MNYESAMMVLMLIKEGIGVAKVLQELAERALDGDDISDQEIEDARDEIRSAMDELRAAH